MLLQGRSFFFQPLVMEGMVTQGAWQGTTKVRSKASELQHRYLSALGCEQLTKSGRLHAARDM